MHFPVVKQSVVLSPKSKKSTGEGIRLFYNLGIKNARKFELNRTLRGKIKFFRLFDFANMDIIF